MEAFDIELLMPVSCQMIIDFEEVEAQLNLAAARELPSLTS